MDKERKKRPIGTKGVRAGLAERDLRHIWHPYTQMKDCESMPPIPLAKARGIKLFTPDGSYYYDTISSWWCNVHGHCHPHIVRAIRQQARRLDHVLFAGFTHEPAVKLAERLTAIAPKGLSKVFFSDNGSTAVEVALKLSVQFWQMKGKPDKRCFLGLDRGYHGDTFGAMSVSGVDLYNKRFEPMFFRAFKAPAPYCYRCASGMGGVGCSLNCLAEMEKILKRYHEKIAAIILEPMFLGAGGMIVYPALYLKKTAELAKKYKVHLILDEVASGFGRTGKMFASEHAGVSPDIMCVSKGLTSGYLPLAATLVKEELFRAFYGDFDKFKTFYHGHTYTANPIACAAANASLDVFDMEGSLDNVGLINRSLKSFLSDMSGLGIVGDTRCIGVVGALELVKDKSTKCSFGPKRRIGQEIYRAGLLRNLLLRPLGDIVYFFLPLSARQRELNEIFEKASEVIYEINSCS
ncbi:MAG: adenosylmethionine--8-amino-7-oxononanoate transaminase [Candidatus Omnitrophica bacterium]|nr:adenosylmethionine--8-amino-7-oxononanoate transaminase [Candidatus Omnitrophota bacterium]